MNSPPITDKNTPPEDEWPDNFGYQLLFEKHPNPMLIFSLADFTILNINPAAIEKYGYSREEFLKLTMLDIRPAEDKEFFLNFMASAEKNFRINGHWRHQKKNGEIIFVQVSSQPITWQGKEARIFSINDITELKNTEYRLRESEKLYKHVIENAGDYIYTTDANGYFLDANEAALKVSGYTLEELHGYRYIDLIAPDFRKKIAYRYMRQFLNQEKSLHVEFPFVTKSGAIRWFGQYSTLICKESEPVGFHVIGYDITSRKIAEVELNKANIALERRVEERTGELGKTLERLQGALEREKELSELKSRFVTMISHEFRTPLTSILSNTEILQRYGEHIEKPKREKMYTVIVESIRHMTHLLEDVLEFSRANHTKLSFHPDSHNPLTVFEDIVEQARTIHSEREILLQFSGKRENVCFERKLLRVIVTNLLSNALKYSPKTSPVEITLHVEERTMHFTVSDYGIGMNEEELQNLFEPFYRGKSVETIHGTGLGLSIVQQSVERHDGKISVQSEAGKGTRFSVELPISEVHA
ncbi:MAG: PAS domain-containing sensor histidine kinase [Bacteroidota bacterium]